MSSAVWRKSPLVAEVAHYHDDRVALLHLDSAQPVVLEGPAADIWALIDGAGSETAIIEQLARHYGETAAVIAEQTAEFLVSLANQKLIEPVLPIK